MTTQSTSVMKEYRPESCLRVALSAFSGVVTSTSARALGTAGLRSRSPETTYTVARILEPLPLALLLIGERAERRDEERSPAL